MPESPSPESARAYGVLATSFSEALRDARAALEPHAALLPPGRLDEIDALLGEFERRRVRIAVYGEVKAGKSTLVNAIAGAVLSPAAFDPLTCVPIRLTYGASPGWHTAGRSFAAVDELAQAMRDGTASGEEVVVTTALDLLHLGGQVDLVDTPGVGSEERLDTVTGAVLRTLDAVVLVVRYPALSTQYTRALVRELQADISKLFVVWNLDAACRELSDEERRRHRETLQGNVGGAHELHLVDAKAALQAKLDNAGDIRATGLPDLISGLAAFAGSDKREVSALREASKRCSALLDEARAPLQARHDALEQSLAATRQRLAAVDRQAEERASQARAELANLETAVDEAGQQHMAKARQLAAELRKQLRNARRAWVRRADLDRLDEAIRDATRAYADGIDGLLRGTTDAIRAAAHTFGSETQVAPRDRVVPMVDTICPSERAERSRSGRLPYFRRALWHRWYLPGMAPLATTAINDDLTSQQQWFESSAGSTIASGHATLERRLAELQRQAQIDAERIKQETHFVAESEEKTALEQHLPEVAQASEQVREISAEAWYLA